MHKNKNQSVDSPLQQLELHSDSLPMANEPGASELEHGSYNITLFTGDAYEASDTEEDTPDLYADE